MKKGYKKPEIEINLFQIEDIMVDSGIGPEIPGGDA